MNEIIRIFFPGKNFSNKYSHVGNCWADVPDKWTNHVQKCVVEIEKLMWPQWIPFWLKRLIHYLAAGNNVFYVRNAFFDLIRHYLTGSAIICSIHEKYGTLRFEGMFTNEMDLLIKDAETICGKTCIWCGGSCVRKITSPTGRIDQNHTRFIYSDFQCKKYGLGLRLKVK